MQFYVNKIKDNYIEVIDKMSFKYIVLNAKNFELFSRDCSNELDYIRVANIDNLSPLLTYVHNQHLSYKTISFERLTPDELAECITYKVLDTNEWKIRGRDVLNISVLAKAGNSILVFDYDEKTEAVYVKVDKDYVFIHDSLSNLSEARAYRVRSSLKDELQYVTNRDINWISNEVGVLIKL